MKVEFLINTALGDGKQLFITASEFNKGMKDEDEFNSFGFATEAFFATYDIYRFIDKREYEHIRKHLDKNGAVIISAEEIPYTRKIIPCVYVSNNNKLKYIDLELIDEV